MTQFQPRMLADGVACCSAPYALCLTCRAYHNLSDDAYADIQHRWNNAALRQLRHAASYKAPSEETNDMRTYPAPDPYEQPITALRTTAAAAADSFEERYRDQRRREMDAMRARLDAEPEEPEQPHLVTAEELARYAAPDPYAEGLKALREKEARGSIRQ